MPSYRIMELLMSHLLCFPRADCVSADGAAKLRQRYGLESRRLRDRIRT